MSNLKIKIMAKKYTNTDVKSLKRDEIIKLLNENNIEFDSTQSLFSLRSLLLDVEVAETEQAAEVAEVAEAAEVAEVAEVEQAAEDFEGLNENTEIDSVEDEEPVEEKPIDKEIAHAAFQNELSKRMATFGRAKQSVFSIELARRQGKITGKLSFAEELKIRQNKVRK